MGLRAAAGERFRPLHTSIGSCHVLVSIACMLHHAVACVKEEASYQMLVSKRAAQFNASVAGSPVQLVYMAKEPVLPAGCPACQWQGQNQAGSLCLARHRQRWQIGVVKYDVCTIITPDTPDWDGIVQDDGRK